jgi:hypothetical protein
LPWQLALAESQKGQAGTTESPVVVCASELARSGPVNFH